MEPIIEAFTSHWYFSLGMTIVVIHIVGTTMRSISNNAARERTRREIAAYIAEGSMTTNEGERLLNAGKGKGRCG